MKKSLIVLPSTLLALDLAAKNLGAYKDTGMEERIQLMSDANEVQSRLAHVERLIREICKAPPGEIQDVWDAFAEAVDDMSESLCNFTEAHAPDDDL